MKQNLCQHNSLRLLVFHFNVIFLIPFVLPAQVDSVNTISNVLLTNLKDSSTIGAYTLSLPEGLDQLIESYKKVNYTSTGVDGYRVQIFSESGNNAKEHAQQSLSEFNQSNAGINSAYLIYQQPNFKVRCGDYRTKAEARRLLKQLSGQYPGAYIVKDNIKIP
jgi:hypothetical protein